MTAGLLDSFGLALGWTLFSLVAVAKGGLPAASLFNAAMLVGIMVSAPVTAWLTDRLSGRTVLRAATLTEAALRVGTLLALLAGWSSALIAVGVLIMHVAAWVGFAAMRAEVAAVDGRPAAMTRYTLGIAAVEATGIGFAALLPIGPGGTVSGRLVTVVCVVYAGSMLLTLLSAGRARVLSTRHSRAVARARSLSRVERRRGERLRLPVGLLAGGAGIMVLASGPTLLSVALASTLHGQASVAGAAVAFTVGCLLSSATAELVERFHLPLPVIWPLWGIGMVAGWIVAPISVFGLFAAQLLSGLSMTALEGGMDARVARQANPGTVTTVLAWSAAVRALGSAVAVRFLPLIVLAPAIGTVGAVATAALVAIGVVGGLGVVVRRHGLRVTLAPLPVTTYRRLGPNPSTTPGRLETH